MIGFSCAAHIAAAANRNRRERTFQHGFVLILTMLMAALCATSTASAGTVTAPNGGLVNYQSSLTVNWNGIANANGVVKPVDIDLVVGTNNTLVGVAAFANNVANNSHYALPLAPGACQMLPPGYYYQVIVQAGFLQPGADWGVSAPFRFNCPHVIGTNTFARRIFSTGSLHPYKGPTKLGAGGQPSEKPLNTHSPQSGGQGSLNIQQSVGFTQGLPVPPNFLNFTMTVNCTPSGPVNQTVAVSTTNAAGLTINGIAANSVCTVTEAPLALVAHAPDCGGNGMAHWTYQAPQSVTIAANTTAHVATSNWLECGPSSGWISVNKVVVNTTGAAVPASFAMTAHCNEAAGQTTVPLSLQASPGYWENFGADVGSSCTITETPLAPIGHVKNCNGGSASWTTSYAPAQSVIAVDSANGTLTHVTVTNKLTCDQTPAGHLSIYKKVVNDTGGPVPSMPSSFNVAVHCTPSGPLGTTLPVPTNSGVSLAAPIAANSTCSVHEQPLADILNLKQCKGAGASWTTSYSPGVVIVAGVTSTMTVTNRLSCNKPPTTGSLRVIKTVINATGAPVALPTSFGMAVDCPTPTSFHQTFPVAPGSTGTTIAGIAATSSCTVKEDHLSSIAHVEGCHGGSASWSTFIAPGQPVTVAANATTTVTVRNTLTCDKATRPSKGNDIAPIGGPSQGRANVGIKKTVISGRVPVGGNGVFELTLTSYSGPLGKGTSVEVSDILPVGLVPLFVEGPCRTSGNTVTCSLGSKFQTGVFPKIRITARAIHAGTFENCASVRIIDPAGQGAGSNMSCATLRVGLDEGPTHAAPPKLIVPPPTNPTPTHGNKPGNKPGAGTYP